VPKVQYLKAAKDYPGTEIVKGDMYHKARLKTGARSGIILRQLKPFRRSQLTVSPFLGPLYDIEDDQAEVQCVPDCADIAERYRELTVACEASLDLIPEQLHTGHIGQLLTDRAAACEAAAEEIDSAIGEIEDEETPTDDELDTVLEATRQVSAEA